MRGSLRKVTTKRKLPKGQTAWQIMISLGRGANGKYKQKWVRVIGTKEKAEAKLNELLHEVNQGEFLEPSKLTVGEYLSEWLETSIRPRRAANTVDSYSGFIKNHLKPSLGEIPLQKLNPMHVERMYRQVRACSEESGYGPCDPGNSAESGGDERDVAKQCREQGSEQAVYPTNRRFGA